MKPFNWIFKFHFNFLYVFLCTFATLREIYQARNLQPSFLMTDCIFCQIINKTAPATILHEDEDCIVIQTIQPLSPIHLLIIPKRHIASVNELDEADAALTGRLILTAKAMAQKFGVAESGYRLAINTGRGGGQSVAHLHIHLLAGKQMDEELMIKGLA
jgi:histidine triad (HIT) family protein